MKLSEAIRLGAMLRPQSKGGGEDGVTACALLGAAIVMGIECMFDPRAGRRFVNYAALWKAFPFLEQRMIGPLNLGNRTLTEHIWMLNDVHGWTREQIADWVETIEATQAPQAAPAEAIVREIAQRLTNKYFITK